VGFVGPTHQRLRAGRMDQRRPLAHTPSTRRVHRQRCTAAPHGDLSAHNTTRHRHRADRLMRALTTRPHPGTARRQCAVRLHRRRVRPADSSRADHPEPMPRGRTGRQWATAGRRCWAHPARRPHSRLERADTAPPRLRGANGGTGVGRLTSIISIVGGPGSGVRGRCSGPRWRVT
jgi:hypothetical protein